MKTVIVLSVFCDNKNKYEDYTHNHAKEYIKKGYKVHVFAPFSILSKKRIFKNNKVLEIDGITVHLKRRLSLSNFFQKFSLDLNDWLYYQSIKKEIRKIIKTEDVVLIDANSGKAKSYAAYKIKKTYPKIKTVLTFHGGELAQSLTFKNGRRRIKKYGETVDWCVCVSKKLANQISNLGLKNVKVIYNGINMPKIKRETKEKIIISVGNLIKSKNFSLLIDSFSLFSKNNPQYRLKIIGDGYLKESLIKQVKELGLEDKIEFLGQVPNEIVYKELSKAKVFILASRPEGFGIVYAEAMYCGCITIGTKNEGIDGFIKNKINGFLINPAKEEIKTILEYAVSNNCDTIVKQGTQDVKNLTWERNCQEYINLK